MVVSVTKAQIIVGISDMKIMSVGIHRFVVVDDVETEDCFCRFDIELSVRGSWLLCHGRKDITWSKSVIRRCETF